MTEWISVTERLPEPYKHVILFGDDEVFIGFRTICEKYPHIEIFMGFPTYSGNYPFTAEPIIDYEIDGKIFVITHWMPLPEKPKE